MDRLSISELQPELPELPSKQIRGTVTLIWPYSSSARQFAFLLGDPDFRLRRRNGQVRVRFSGSSARAVASTGVGIGDEVVLSLRGATFVRDSLVNTPGKSIDWELSYSQTLSAQIVREGTQLADLDLVDVAPTPAPHSPVRPRASIESSHQWSSPAFLKRMRLSDIPLLKPADHTLADDIDSENARKRRRHSYRDWSAWKYVGRTPSPDKEDIDMEQPVSADASPTRGTHLPDTPVSPIRAPASSSLDLPPEADKDALDADLGEEATLGDYPAGIDAVQTGGHDLRTSEPADDTSRDTLDDELYAGPDGQSIHRRSPSQDSIASYRDEDETFVDSEGSSQADAASVIGTEDSTSAPVRRHSSELIELSSEADEAEIEMGTSVAHDVIEDTSIQAATEEVRDLIDEVSVRQTHERSGTHDEPEILRDALNGAVTMPPPPTLSLLDTDFQATYRPGLLTPIGKEPSSPSLQPLDSSTLPMPSPFPGERDGTVTSYLDYVSSSQQPNQQTAIEPSEPERPDEEADYILETSFYSSVSSSKAPSTFPTHESAFTDVRFTFGMDGATGSRPQAASGTANAVDHLDAEEVRFSSPLPAEERAGDTAGKDDPSSNASSARLAQAVSTTADYTLFPSTKASSEIPVVTENEHELIRIEEQSHDLGTPGHDDIQTSILPDQHSPTAPEVIALESPSNPEAEGSKMEIDPDAGSDVQREQSHESDSAIESIEERPTEYEEPQSEHEKTMTPELQSENMLVDSPPRGASFEQLQTSTRIDQPNLLGDSTVASTVGLVAEILNQSGQGSSSTQEDLKMETLEETFSSFIDEDGGQMEEAVTLIDSSEKPIATLEAEQVADVLKPISPPDTAPARNTRSKVKTAALTGDETLESSPKIRANKRSSLAPLSELPPRAVSPPVTRSKLIASPSQESFTTSPYSLRSQSKHLSPSKPSPTSARGRNVRRLSKQSMSSAGPSPLQESFTQDTLHADGSDYQWSHFGPSQELGALPASQSRFSDVHHVNDSEEGSMRSEQSLSTVQDADDQSVDQHVDDPVISDVQARGSTPTPGKGRTRRMKAASPAMPVLKTGPEVNATDDSEVPLTPSFTSQLLPSSPARSVHSIAAASIASSTPRRSRRLNKGSPHPPADVGMTDEEGHRNMQRSSPAYREEDTTAVEAEALLIGSPRVDGTQVVPSDQRPLLPITPDDTQATLVNSHVSMTPIPEQALLPTPQLTQSTSAAVRSVNTSYTVDPESGAAPGPEPVSDRKASTKDVASRSASPQASTHSVSDEEVTAVEVEKPSIGLSTPIAYYTPLKDLPYFLNRSSAFHSAGSPDVLALVTTASTPPTRASKGPKHHNTTLHVTDLSVYPAQTTVQVFRAYANALPVAEPGDVVLLRGMSVKSLNRHPCLISADESAWCVWRYSKPLWGTKREAYAEVKSREEVNGPAVERGEGEWVEVEKLRAWYVDVVKGELDDKVKRTRSKDKQGEGSQPASQS